MANQKTAVVSGGSGFIGSHLCDALLSRGVKVIAIDNFITGVRANVVGAEKNKNFELREIDVCDLSEADEKVDFVYHLASPASVPDYQAYPLETLHVNTIGTENMLKLARRNNAFFLYSSTSEVYGDPKEHPQKESYWGNVNPVGPRSCYDESKRLGETLTSIYHNIYRLNTRIVRIFNTYGPRMRKNDGRVISNFINQAIKNEPITVYGDGTQTRSFCFVDDMISGLITIMESDKVSGEIVNMGNTTEFKIKDLAEKIKAITGSTSEIVAKPLPVDDPKERRPDLSKVKSLIGWEPKTSFEEGLAKTIDYYRQT